jgi:hypothetical protein
MGNPSGGLDWKRLRDDPIYEPGRLYNAFRKPSLMAAVPLVLGAIAAAAVIVGILTAIARAA